MHTTVHRCRNRVVVKLSSSCPKGSYHRTIRWYAHSGATCLPSSSQECPKACTLEYRSVIDRGLKRANFVQSPERWIPRVTGGKAVWNKLRQRQLQTKQHTKSSPVYSPHSYHSDSFEIHRHVF
jgi:hypothetical protein